MRAGLASRLGRCGSDDGGTTTPLSSCAGRATSGRSWATGASAARCPARVVGSANRKPWPNSQPMSRSRSSWPGSSMPSATILARASGPARRSRAAKAHSSDRRLARTDEVARDLEDVDAEAAQVAERRVAGTEVVDGHLARPARRSLDAGEGRLRVAEHGRLGHLEREPMRARGRSSSRIGQVGDEVGLLSWGAARLTVSSSGLWSGTRMSSRATSRQASSSTLLPSGEDAAALLGEADESSGATRPRVGVEPADERLDADDAARAELDDGLEEDAQLAPADALAPGRRSSRGAPRSRHGRRVEDGEAALALALGGVHRHVGVAQQLVRPLRCPSRAAATPTLAEIEISCPSTWNESLSASSTRWVTARARDRSGRVEAGWRTRRRRAARRGRRRARNRARGRRRRPAADRRRRGPGCR